MCSAQTMSSCTAPDSIILKYQNDADRLALRWVDENELTYADSTAIPGELSDSVMHALLAVYNAVNIPERDTVVMVNDIHSFPKPELRILTVEADSSLSWMRRLRHDSIPTGNDTVDHLISQFGLEIYSYNILWKFPQHEVIFMADTNYNLVPVVDTFKTVSGVLIARLGAYFGSGNDITANLTPDYTELTYSFGWGDCVRGCTNIRFWKFDVYPDCSVEFKEAYEFPQDYTGFTDHKSSPDLYPNPFRDEIHIDGLTGKYEYTICNGMGQKLMQGKITGKVIGNLGDLPSGLYYLKLKSDEQTTVFKLLKK